MKPEALPMHGLQKFGDRQWLSGNVRLASAADSQHALELMREDFDEARQRLHPAVENVLRALASGQLVMAFHQATDQFDVTRLDHRLQIHRSQIASLLGG